MTMDQKNALKMALACMELRRKEIAFDANVAMRFPDPPPSMVNRRDEYKKIVKGMAEINAMLSQGDLL
jgi:hypothetical protein